MNAYRDSRPARGIPALQRGEDVKWARAWPMRTPDAIARIPEQFRDKVLRLHSEYDPTEHVIPGGKNVALMRELGLSEFLGNFDVVAGPADHVGEVMDRLATMGVDAFFMAAPGHEEPEPTMRGLAEIFAKSAATS